MAAFLVADSVVDSILFDVIDVSTKEQVTSGGNPVRPIYDYVGFPSGLGFGQSVEVAEGDAVDTVIEQTLTKKELSFVFAWKGANAYARYQAFASWIARYFNLEDYRIRFSYDVGTRRYVELTPTSCELQEREIRYVSAEVTFKTLTPFYEEVASTIVITEETQQTDKVYAYEYPYTYGGGATSGENILENTYLKNIPLRIILKGPIDTPFVSVQTCDADGNLIPDESGSTVAYASVSFNRGLTLNENQELVIDAFYTRVYRVTRDPDTGLALSTEDVFSEVNKNGESFIYAKPGYTKITAGLASSSTAGKASCTVEYVRYVL